MGYLKKMMYSILAALFIGAPLAVISGVTNKTMVGVAVGAITFAILSLCRTRISSDDGYNQKLREEIRQKSQQIDEAIEKHPNDCNALLERASISSFKGNYRRAIQDCKEVLEKDPENLEAHSTLGLVFDQKGDYQSAIKEFSHVIERNSTDPSVFISRGIAHSNAKNFDQAISDYLTAIKIDPGEAAAYNNLGLAYVEQGKHVDAIAQYSRAITLDPRYASAYDNRGYASMKMGDMHCFIDFYLACKFGNCNNWNVAVRNNDVPIIPKIITAEYNLKPPTGALSIEEKLIRSAAAADRSMLMDLLSSSPDLNAAPRGVTALHVVAERGYLDLAEVLIDNGANVDIHCDSMEPLNGHSPLVLAVKSRNIDMLSLLVNKGASINMRDGGGLTPLGAALLEIDTLVFDRFASVDQELLKALLWLGADPNVQFNLDKDKYADVTPIMVAAMDSGHKGAIEVCKILMENGANAGATSKTGISAIEMAYQAGNGGLVKLLRKTQRAA